MGHRRHETDRMVGKEENSAPIRKPTMPESERRRFARYTMGEQEINLWAAGRAFRGELVDQGIGGAGVRVEPLAKYVMAVGSQVQVQTIHWSMVGTLRYTKPDGLLLHCGLEWLDTREG